ncbi:MAG: spermidine/putrescine ABC transporter substrate-binding protein [Oscillospiraceae bacterium]|nr:spermidine/putrescine ABC transporter substrate-binding protein [Oscillospiraceae bacterium]
MAKNKIISKILAAALFVAVLAPMCALSSCSKGDRQVVNVYNWGEYISDASGTTDVLREFEAKTGIKVNYTTYATNEELYSKLKGGGANYDVIIPSDYMISRLIKEGMLEKIDFGNVPNYGNIMEEYKNLDFDPENEYSVPYTWGTVVLIYNAKYVTKTVDSWNILWDEDYKGKIIMFHNSRDAFGIALKKLGFSLNTTDFGELEKAAEELKKQKEVLQGYYMDEIFNKMGNGEAYIAPYYAGDALTMMDDNPDLEAVYPVEGTNLFVDSMCIPKGAKNKEAAEKFINFMCEAEIAAANSEFIGYSSPNLAAYEILDEELKNNEITYPGPEVLSKTEMFINLPDEVNRKIDDLWTEIRGSSSDNILLFPAIIAVLVVLCVVIIIVGRSKKKKSRMY